MDSEYGSTAAYDTGGDETAGSSMPDKLGAARESVREQSQPAKQGFQTMLEEQPFVVGALGIALGAVIGALIPESEREVRVFGDARETAQHAVEGARGP